MLRRLKVALSFLTILPVAPKEIKADDLGKSVAFFPWVGALYGAVTWGFLSGLTKIFNAEIAAWLTVCFIVILNGCLHLDGWADTMDGLGARPPEKLRDIMKDSRLGAFGGAALCLLLLGKVFILKTLVRGDITLFIAVSVLSRWVMATQIYTMPSVSSGLLLNFYQDGKEKKTGFALAAFFMLILVLPAGFQGAILLVVSTVIFFWLNRFIQRRFGGITGDTLGTANEFVELVCLLVINMMKRF